MKNRLAQGMSLNTIVILILILIVLLVVSGLFVTKVGDSGRQIDSIKDTYFNPYNVEISKQDLPGERTLIQIEIKEEGENLLVKNDIPKEVIPRLTKENKDSLIESEMDYVILRENPLIAWNVNKAPTKFNYTINKDVSDDDLEKFRVAVEKNNNLTYIIYLVYVVIIIILILVFKPIIVGQKKK